MGRSFIGAIVQARAVMPVGQGDVFSIDHDTGFVEGTRLALEESGLSDGTTATHAPLTGGVIGGREGQWYDSLSLPVLDSIDRLFVDGPSADSWRPLTRYPARPVLLPRLSAGGAVIVDGAGRPGEIEVLRRWSVEIPDLGQWGRDCEKGCCELRLATPPAGGEGSGSAAWPARVEPAPAAS